MSTKISKVICRHIIRALELLEGDSRRFVPIGEIERLVKYQMRHNKTRPQLGKEIRRSLIHLSCCGDLNFKNTPKYMMMRRSIATINGEQNPTNQCCCACGKHVDTDQILEEPVPYENILNYLNFMVHDKRLHVFDLADSMEEMYPSD